MNFGAHSKFVEKWLGILAEEGKAEASAPPAAPTERADGSDTQAPATTSEAEAPATS